MSSSLNFSKKLILFTIIYNLLEGVFALYFGIDENSTSLLSFGIDSFIEIFASTIALLGLSIKSNLSEKFAEKLIAYSFLLLVVFILFKSTYDMINSYRPEPSFYGILIAIVSILVEGPLAYKKLKIGKESNNSIIIAEAKETLFCLNLSVLVIVGVGVNYLTNLWYFDPVAALLMIPWLLYEFYQHRWYMITAMNSHTFLAKTIHWTFSILYAYGIFKQVDDLDELEDPALLNFEIIFAVAFLIVVFIRYFYMKDTKTLLGAHYEVHKGHLFIAKATHRIVYFSLIMLPTTGLLIAGVFNSGIPGMRIAIALHEFAAFLSYITIGIHVAASLYSRFKGEGIWNAMVPVWQESKKNDSKIVSTLETIEQKVYNVIQERLLK